MVSVFILLLFRTITSFLGYGRFHGGQRLCALSQSALFVGSASAAAPQATRSVATASPLSDVIWIALTNLLPMLLTTARDGASSLGSRPSDSHTPRRTSTCLRVSSRCLLHSSF